MIKPVNARIAQLSKEHKGIYAEGRALYNEGHCQILSQSAGWFDILIEDNKEDFEVSIEESSGELNYYFNGKKKHPWDSYGIAALMQVKAELEDIRPRPALQGHSYTREGMIKRVLKERSEKAEKENYRIAFADNIYGEHILTNEKGIKYKITLRDFKNETGYIDNPDLKTNKLGTTKHIMYAFAKLKSNRKLYGRLSKKYPFVEVYLDPLNEYFITWHYPHPLNPEIDKLIQKYFKKNKYINDSDAKEFPQIIIRSEVEEKVKKAWEVANK